MLNVSEHYKNKLIVYVSALCLVLHDATPLLIQNRIYLKNHLPIGIYGMYMTGNGYKMTDTGVRSFSVRYTQLKLSVTSDLFQV